MAIDDLLRVICPPDAPIYAGLAERWPEIQRRLGIALPKDYLDYALRYGSGGFSTHLTINVFNPFSPGYVETVQFYADSLRRRRGLEGRRGVPHGMFPDQPGWLPLGKGIEGELLCWVTEGEPDSWPLLLIGPHGMRFYQQVNLPLTTFLARVHSGSLRMFLDPPGVADTRHSSFIPARRLSGEQNDPEANRSLEPRIAQPVPVAEPPSPPSIEWFPPDDLGRVAGVRAIIRPCDIPATTRRLTEYPDWWATELPLPLTRCIRRSLLPYSLGEPEASAAHNLVALTWGTHLCLASFEASVLARVRQGNHLVYMVNVSYHNGRHPWEIAIRYYRQPGTTGPYPFGTAGEIFRCDWPKQ